MTDEERQRAMDFILEQQAQLCLNQRKGEERTNQLERIVRLMISADWRTRRQANETQVRFEQRFARFTDALTVLAEARTRPDASPAQTDDITGLADEIQNEDS